MKAGEVLAKLTIPGWTEAQTEYLVQRETHAPQGAIEGTLRRLKLIGMPQKDIDDLIRTRRVKTVFTIEAPISGVVTAISMRAGMNVNASQTVAEIEGIPEQTHQRGRSGSAFRSPIPKERCAPA